MIRYVLAKALMTKKSANSLISCKLFFSGIDPKTKAAIEIEYCRKLESFNPSLKNVLNLNRTNVYIYLPIRHPGKGSF